MKRVLITGANSYIGASLERYIAGHYPGECAFDTVDMIDPSWREKHFSGYDVVFHVAGIAHKKETKENAESYFVINRDLAVETASKAKEEGVSQFIFLSSMSVYGLLEGYIRADTEPAPTTRYGESKLQAENEIVSLQNENFKVCILRPPMIYGKGCRGNYQTLRKFALKFKLFPYVENKRSMLYIENLCEFVRLMILHEESGIFFPQNREYANTSKMVKTIAGVNGRTLHLVRGFGWAVKFLALFTSLARKAFGSLTYDQSMSEYKTDYIVTDLNGSVRRTENGETSEDFRHNGKL